MTPSQRLLDKQLPEGLISFIANRRADDHSWESIAQDIRDATSRQDAVTANTVRRWHTEF